MYTIIYDPIQDVILCKKDINSINLIENLKILFEYEITDYINLSSTSDDKLRLYKIPYEINNKYSFYICTNIKHYTTGNYSESPDTSIDLLINYNRILSQKNEIQDTPTETDLNKVMVHNLLCHTAREYIDLLYSYDLIRLNESFGDALNINLVYETFNIKLITLLAEINKKYGVDFIRIKLAKKTAIKPIQSEVSKKYYFNKTDSVDIHLMTLTKKLLDTIIIKLDHNKMKDTLKFNVFCIVKLKTLNYKHGKAFLNIFMPKNLFINLDETIPELLI
jgi:hypothetical protein